MNFEKLLFILLVLVHLLPVAMLDFFVTLDGPSHTYNASLIMRLLTQEPGVCSIYQFNSGILPNWTGHIIMIFLNIFFTPHVSEKIIICSYIVALPFSFRVLVRKINPQNILLSYLIFPFIYSFLLYLGFYNFCIALVVLFTGLSYWLSIEVSLGLKNIFILSFLLLLLYFSHPLVLVLFYFVVGIRIAYSYFFSAAEGRNTGKLKLFLAIILPSLSLLLYFIITKSGDKFPGEEVDLSEHMEWLFFCRPLIALIYDEEKMFSVTVAIVFALLLLYILAQALMRKKISGESWCILPLFLLLAYFIIPNNVASGGFVTVRILLFFYFSLILWFVSSAIPRLMQLGVALICLCTSLWFLHYHFVKMKNLDNDAKEYFSVTNEIKAGSLVLPLGYSENWMHINLYSYVGTVKNIALLDNYEAVSPHFPLTWVKGMSPYDIFGRSFGENPPCAEIDKFEPATSKKIDYVMRWCYRKEINDSCTLKINSILVQKYDLIFVSSQGRAELFKIKEQDTK